MKKCFIEISGYQNPEIIFDKEGLVIKRGFQIFSLNTLGDQGGELIESIINKCNYIDVINWVNEQPIIIKSKMIGILNTLFANRILKVTAINEKSQLLSIEGLNKSSKMIGRLNLERVNDHNIYIYSQEDVWYMESFSNKTFLSSNKSNHMIVNFVDAIRETEEESKGQDISNNQLINEIIYIFRLNEMVKGEYENPNTKKYWNFHDKVFDRRTRSWNDNVMRSGSYRFIPDQAPYSNTIKGNKALEYHRKSDIISPLSERIGEESLIINNIELNELCARAFMDIEVNNGSKTNDKYKKERYRPYPSAGGIYELEIYILVKNPGDECYSLIKYNPNLNKLTGIGQEAKTTNEISEYVRRCWTTETAPRYILMLVGDYSKLSFKYENIAYRLMLLNAGCAVSSFYRACKSLSIGCCCTGCGPSDLIRCIIPNGENLTPIVEIGFGRRNG